MKLIPNQYPEPNSGAISRTYGAEPNGSAASKIQQLSTVASQSCLLLIHPDHHKVRR